MACQGSGRDVPVATRGVLDLRQWDFAQQGTVSLSGEWAFHWGRLLPEADGSASELGEPSGYFKVPESWTWHDHEPSFPLEGEATYQLELLLPPHAGELDVYLRDVIVAQDFQIRVDGQILRPWASAPGQLGPQLISTALKSFRLPLKAGASRARLSIEMRNRDFTLMSGFHRVPYLGPLHALERQRERAMAQDIFIFAAMIILGLYHFFIYGFRTSHKINLHYALGLCVLSLLVLTNNEGIYQLVIDGDVHLVKVYCLFAYSTAMLYYNYTYHLFYEHYAQKIFRAQTWISLVLASIVLLSPFSVYRFTIPIFHACTAASTLYVIYVVLQAMKERKAGAGIYIFSSVVVFVVGINDMLYAVGIIHTGLYSSWAGLLFVAMQSLLLSKRYAVALMVESSVEAARLVQASLLPPKLAIDGLVIRGVYQAAEAAGGDWYYYFHDEEADDLYVFVADVTGHGISTAIVTGTVSGIIRTTLHRQRRDAPSVRLLDIMYEANRGLLEMSNEEQTHSMTMVGLTFNLKTGRGAFVNAGHTTPMQKHGERLEFLLRPSSPLGLTTHPLYTAEPFTIKERLLLFLFTDGLIENKNRAGRALKMRLIAKLLREAQAGEEFFVNLGKMTAEHWQGLRLEDDVTYLVIDWTPPAQMRAAADEAAFDESVDASHDAAS